MDWGNYSKSLRDPPEEIWGLAGSDINKTTVSGVPVRPRGFLWPGSGPCSLLSAGRTKYQSRRPILARFHSPAEKSKVLGDSELVKSIDQTQKQGQKYLQYVYETCTLLHCFIRMEFVIIVPMHINRSD